LNADDLIVAPGFIDVHTHSDISLLHSPGAEHKLLQGITTEVLGNCGLGVTPLPSERREEIQDYMAFLFGDNNTHPWPWESLADYLDHLEAAKPAVNALTLIAHGVVRLATMGFDDGPAGPAQIATMKDMVSKALEEGAYGLSTGLQYPPGCYATSEELIQLASVMSRYGGLYATHMRSQSTGLLQSIRDSIRVGRAAKVPVQISHLLAMGEVNWSDFKPGLTLIEEARAEGVDVSYDMYPYLAGCTMLRAVLPPWTMEGGNAAAVQRLGNPEERARLREDLARDHEDWDNIARMVGWHNLLIVQLKNPDNQHLVGKTLQEIADFAGSDPIDYTMDILASEGMEGTMVVFLSSEENIRQAVCGRHGMFGSDSLHTPDGMGMVHPRTYGAYPRYFARYVRQEKALNIEAAVRKATGTPSARFGLQDRGLIRVGMAADLAIIDLARIQDQATYLDPRRTSSGVVHVLVNGEVVVQDGDPTGVRPGRVLRSEWQSG
jgi:N-acyl-D-amino-acid deacylase